MQESGHDRADPHRVAVLALAPVVGFDLTIPPQLFGAATSADGSPLYDVRICGLDGRAGPGDAGFAIARTTAPRHWPTPTP